MLIAMCGIDGSGKTTQGKLLLNYYNELGIKAAFVKQHTKEYYTNRDMNNYLYNKNYRTEATTKEMAFLSAYDRFKQYNNEIRPRLEDGFIVIVDRYIYSAYAYSMARGLELPWLLRINKIVPNPDVTIYLDVDVNEAQKRIRNREQLSVEEMNKTFQRRARSYYLSEVWGKGNNYFVVDGSGEIVDVHRQILKRLIAK